MAKDKKADSVLEESPVIHENEAAKNHANLEAAGLSRKPKLGGKVAIYVQRADDIVYELIEIRDGEVNTIVRDAYSIVMNRAQYMLQTMAEGGDV